MANVGEKEARGFAIRAKDLIISCKYLSYPCDIHDFVLYRHPTFISCYTFKATILKNNHSLRSYINKIGPNNGLSLILTSQEQSSNPFYDRISNTGNTRNFGAGIDLLPGMSTSFAILQKECQRLKHPYADCHDSGLSTVGNHSFKTTFNLCIKNCIAKYILEHCKCVSSQLDALFSNMINDSIKYCFFIGEANLKQSVKTSLCAVNTAKNISYEYEYEKQQCKCGWICQELKYDVSVSQAKWPQKFAIPDFVKTYVETAKGSSTMYVF